MFRSLAFIGVLMYVIVVLVRQIPGGFVPEEDQGYIMVNAQLPDAASLERTDAAMKKAEQILEKNEAIEGFNTISGYSLLTSAYSSNMGFFFVQLKPWEERKTEESHANGVVAALNRAFAQQIPEGRVSPSGRRRFRGSAPAPASRCSCRIAAAARRTTWPSRRSASWRRRESGRRSGASARCIAPRVPQVYADIDRSKVLKSGVLLNDVNTTLGALLGSSYINDFNRFGRVYKVYVQAEPEFRSDPKQLGLFFVRNKAGGMVPLDTLVTTRPGAGPEFTNRFNLFRVGGAHRRARRRLFVGAGARRARSRRRVTCCLPDMSFDWADMSYQERKAPGVAVGVRARRLPGVPDPRRAVRELGPAVQRAPRHAVRGLRRLSWTVARAPVHRAELREQRVRADRADHADRPGGEERDSDRRVRQDGARRRGRPWSTSALTAAKLRLPADSHDRLRVHPRRRAAADGVGRRRRSRAR